MTDTTPESMADPFSSSAEVGGGQTISVVLMELAREHDDILLVAPDIGRTPATGRFVDAFPERFIDVGIAETNAVSIAAGLAADGFRPVLIGMGAFLAAKCAEQIRTDVAFNRLPVTMISAWGGIEMGYFGASHHALEDIAVLRGIPGLTIASAADDRATGGLLRTALYSGGPTYLRAASSFGGEVYPDLPDLPVGRVHTLLPPGEVTLVGTGLGVPLALAAAELLRDRGVRAGVLDAAYLKPFDAETVVAAGRAGRGLVVVEEHNVTAGLTALVAEALARAGEPVPVRGIGFPDEELAVAMPPQLLERYGLTPAAVADAAEKLVWRS